MCDVSFLYVYVCAPLLFPYAYISSILEQYMHTGCLTEIYYIENQMINLHLAILRSLLYGEQKL